MSPIDGDTPIHCGEEMRYCQGAHGFFCQVCNKGYGEY